MGKITTVILSMMKIGLIGFGGGNALIPVIEKDIVKDKQLVTRAEYEEDIIIANITPGALPVEIAGGIGKRIAGRSGLLLGASAMAFPGAFLTVLCLSMMSGLSDSLLRQVEFLTVGVTAFIACLLTEYVVKTFTNKQTGKHIVAKSVMIIAGVFILTCGKNLFRILGIDAQPFFAISTVYVFIMAFFAIFYTNCIFTKKNVPVVAVVCMLYVLCIGKNQIITSLVFRRLLELLMIVLALMGVRKNLSYCEKLNKGAIKELLAELLMLIVATGVTLLAAFLVTDESLLYVWKGFLSSIMSFGGGDAYLTVADGLFVSSSMISEDTFYSSIVPVVNILPGSILCKTLSGIGYYIGFENTGSVLAGCVVALAGFVCSVSASAGVFTTIGCFASQFEQVEAFRMIKKWIRAIVAGLMLTVILSLVYQNCKLGRSIGMDYMPVLCMLCVYIMDLILYFKVKLGHGWIVLISAVASCLCCNFLML